MAAMLAQAKVLRSAFLSSRPRLSILRQDLPSKAVNRLFATDASDSTRTTLVVGGGRGLGLEFVKQLLGNSEHKVIAACRNPTSAEELNSLAKEHEGRLSTVQMDITDEDSIQEAFKDISGKHDQLDRLINAAGILHSMDMSPETAISRLEAKNMLTNYKINAMGPMLVAKAFLPLISKAAKAKSKEAPAVIASISARVGSVGDNNSIGGWYSYRASKTALNQLNKCMSIEVARKKQNVACIVLHPGTVDTDLSKPFQKNVKPEKLFSKERAVGQLLDIMNKATAEDSGRFIAWDGQTIPW